jgi:hypothetical protein
MNGRDQARAKMLAKKIAEGGDLTTTEKLQLDQLAVNPRPGVQSILREQLPDGALNPVVENKAPVKKKSTKQSSTKKSTK